MSKTLSFALTGRGAQLIACAEHLLSRGHAIVGVLSDCPDVSAWSRKASVERVGLAADPLAFLARQPFDYLLSIVNHAILSPEVLRSARLLAINYHDSLLPENAGLNASSWVILEGSSTHGVSWHEMLAEVDAGRIFEQPSFEISDDDTAYTLSVRCSEVGIEAFKRLVLRMEQSASEGRPLEGEAQRPGGSFHLRSDRPSLTALDFTQPARVLHGFVRGLNHGPDDNWMSKPKLLLPGGFVALTEVVLDRGRSGAAGTVLSIDERGLTVATVDAALTFPGVQSLDGEPLDADMLRTRFGVSEGTALDERRAELASLRELARELDARASKQERFWVKRLSSMHGPTLPGMTAHAGAAEPRVLTRSLPDALAETAFEERKVVLTAALAAYVARVGEGGPFTLGLGVRESVLPKALEPLYASTLPMPFSGDGSVSFATLCEQTRAELAEQARRNSYARDAVLRYAALRELPRSRFLLPVGVRMFAASDGASALGLLEGAQLTLVVHETGASYSWAYDAAAFAPHAIEQLALRFEVLLSGALASGETQVCDLPLLPPAERELLVSTWQDTRVAYAQRCVHTLFAEQVARTPDHIAVRFRERALSYRELDVRANRVANALRARGVGPEVLVGLCIERSLEMVIGLLAILKAGGAYVPLDPVYPADRIAIMLEDSRAKVLLTEASLADTLPKGDAELLSIEALLDDAALSSEPPSTDVGPDNLAYVIFTSGSTGRPKGVMVLHRNASNFFTGMDRALGHDKPGVWLAVTSISFDISVLELFWTLTRGFEVVVQEELDRASLAKPAASQASASATPMSFGLFYFAAETGEDQAAQGGAYRLLLEGARFADEHGFDAVWTPERHFHEFGGLYPNPAITTAALSTITKRVQLRTGSIVLPLHNPLRVAEDWAVIDHLSGGRIGFSFATGWHVNDFALMPDNYARRHDVLLESIDTVQKLWRGEKISVKNGKGEPTMLGSLPRPISKFPPIWIASAGNVTSFQMAGRHGFNVLTHMLGQDMADLGTKLAAYREAWREAGHAGSGVVSVMLHTFVCADDEKARALAREPFGHYLESSFDLVKVAPTMFPTYKQPSRISAEESAHDLAIDPSTFTPEDMRALLDQAFDRYFDTAGLFGTPEHALGVVEQLKAIGVNEVACLVDFGIDTQTALDNLVHLDRLRQLSNPEKRATVSVRKTVGDDDSFSVGAQLVRRGVTHLQCTPSMARMLLSDSEARAALGKLQKLMLGGEALPRELADELASVVGGEIVNMYGPTETTVWSTTSQVSKTGAPITIGRPIANTTIRILDPHLKLTPVGVAGELCIGGAGVVRGYLGRPDLTNERFIDDPCESGARIYRTGDLARYRADGELEFLGRLDHQVKVSGYRIELGEIESVLARHPDVKQSVVVARSEAGAPSRLVAYVVGRASDPLARPESGNALAADFADGLRAHLRKALPEYMVPALFVQLSALPLTPNGKIDRKALPAPESRAPLALAEFSPPSNDLEQKIAEAWQAVLSLDRVDRSQNIFALGANSLLTVQAANRLSSSLGRKVSLVSMFRFPSIESLAAHLGGDAEVVAESAVKRREEREDRKKDAAERRRQMRAERTPRSS
ncbi:MAG: dhbF [Myxococcaceae bacterium]|nr:dhbF [Myxococcaceae bacterium]